MEYVVGSGLLFAAVLVLAVGRAVLSRKPVAVDGDTFGLNEAFAFLFTVLLAFAVSVLAGKAVDDWSLAGLMLLGASLAVTALAATAAWMLLGRLAGGADSAGSGEVPAGPRAPEADRRGQPAGRAGGRGAEKRRAA